MSKKKEYTQEEIDYILNNYRTTNNKELGKNLGVCAKSMLRVFNRLGIKRTEEEIKNLIDSRDRSNNGSKKRISIEGGRRDNHKAAWHKARWIKNNQSIPKGMVLVYATADYNNADDLILIRRKDYDSFIKKRDKEIAKKAKIVKQEEKKIEREKKKRLTLEKEEKKIKKEKDEEKISDFLENIRKNPTTTQKELEMGKIPVKIDDRTTIYVKKERCEKLDNGTYILKQGEKTRIKSIDSFLESLKTKSMCKNKKIKFNDEY